MCNESQFAFRHKNYAELYFEATNYRRIILIFFSVRGTAVSVVSFATAI